MSRERILIIDDSADIRSFIIDQVLKPNQFAFISAQDGAEGLRKAKQYSPDLILLDLQMPKMGGVEVLQALRIERQNIPIILMTGHGSESIAVEVFRLGVKDYMIKPFVPEEMLEAIERSLVEVRLRKEREQLLERVVRTNLALKQRLQEFNILHSIGQGVAAMLDPEPMMMRIVGAAVMLTQTEEGALYLLEKGRPVCRAIKWRHNERPYLVNEFIDEPVVEKVLQAEKQILVSIPADKERDSTEPSSAIGVPMNTGGKMIGVLVVKNYSQDRPHFTPYEAALLGALSDYGAVALDRARGSSLQTTQTAPVFVPPPEADESKIFVSYSRTDWDAFVNPIVDKLISAGFKVWVDQHLVQGGQNWLDRINDALNECKYMIVCISPDALRSEYVRMEYRYFLHERKSLIPLICTETRLPAELLGIQHFHLAEINRLIHLLSQMMAV